MPLTTRCRHCGRLFPVYAQQIKKRHGKVACPQCGKRFNAIGGLLDEATPVGEIRNEGRGTRGSHRSAATVPADMLDLSEGRGRAKRARGALWYLGILLLFAALVLQIGWWSRGKWMQYPGVRAAVEDVCNRIGCRIPLPRLAGTIEIHQPALTAHEEAPGALQLALTLVNMAAVSQRFPQLQLELYDGKRKLSAARRFGPKEYISDADPGYGLAPGAVRLTLDLEPLPTAAVWFRVKLF